MQESDVAQLQAGKPVLGRDGPVFKCRDSPLSMVSNFVAASLECKGVASISATLRTIQCALEVAVLGYSDTASLKLT